MPHVDRIGSAVVESASATGTITLGAGKAAAVGETVMVAVTVESGAGTIPSVSSVTDSRGNTYAVDKTAGAGTPTPNTTVALILARGAVTTALTAGDTITVTLGETRTRWAVVAETFDDVAASSPLDKTAANDNPASSGSLSSGTTATTSEANELLVAVFGFGTGRTITIPAGWSGGAVVETAAGSTNRAVQLIWRYVSSTGAQTGTLTISPSSTYAGLIATYKLASEAHEGSATISGSLAMTATGSPAVDGSGELAGELAMTATGSASITGGTGAFTGLLTMSARGTADFGIGLPPRPRTRWQLILGPAAGGHELALTRAQNRRYTARLTDNSDLSFSINGRTPQAAAIEELRTDVHLLFTGEDGETQILDRLRVGSTRDSIEDASHTVEVTCLDYRAVLERRILYGTDTLVFTGEDQTDIAWSLINSTQNHAAGDLGIRKGIITDFTGITRDRTYEAGDSIGQRIQELSEVLDGFDWDILPEGASGLAFRAWYPQRGSQRGVVLILGGMVASLTREVNPSDYANAIRYTGAAGDDENPGPTPVEREAGYLSLEGYPEGRWDAVFGDDSLTTQSALEDRAQWQLAQSQVVTPVYTVRLKRGAWRGPDHIWLGDTVRLVVPSGRLDVETSQRVYEIAIDMDGDGGESVELTLGGPKPDFRRWPSQIERRLKGLERR